MLAESYPKHHDIKDIFEKFDSDDEEKYLANIVYLDEHGLIESSIQFGIDGHAMCEIPKITHKGMDFLADDGGLSAILGIVTIKLHDETIRELIALRIEKENPPNKRELLDQLRSLPGGAIKHLNDAITGCGIGQLAGSTSSNTNNFRPIASFS